MMALFQKGREDGEIDLFLTPDGAPYVATLLEEWNGTPCDRPTLAGMELLVGFNEITYYMI